MTPVFVISEFNPFHTGHKKLIDEIKNAVDDAAVVSVLSAPFVQYGGPALLPADVRAKAAVLEGADLVLTLPFPYCVSGARFFATAGVRIASAFSSLSPVLAFGSECGDLELIRRIAQETEREKLFEKSRENDPEIPYAKYLSSAVSERFGEKAAEESGKPNNILGIEYLSAIMREGAGITAMTVKRTDAPDPDRVCSSALREAFYSGDSDRFYRGIPERAAGVFEKAVSEEYFSLGWEGISDAALGTLRMSGEKDPGRFAGAGGGLGERIMYAASRAADIGELFKLCATKRYTNARIRRAVVSMVTGVTEDDIRRPPEYVNVLALSSNGRNILNGYDGSLRIMTKPSETGGESRQGELTLKAMALYDLSLKRRLGSAEFMKRSPFVLASD